MSKYVKADMIVDRVCEGISCNECSFGTNEDGMSECVLDKRIAELPTADVVEVVRCKDCENWDAPYCAVLDDAFDENFFCALGERRKN